MDERIAEALAHKAARKWTNLYLYCRNWLRREAEHTKPRREQAYTDWLPQRRVT